MGGCCAVKINKIILPKASCEGATLYSNYVKFRHRLFTSIFAFSAAIIISCDDNKSSSVVPVDEQLAALILNNNLDGDALNGAVPPAIGGPMADLGKRLFFSKSLGGEMGGSAAPITNNMVD